MIMIRLKVPHSGFHVTSLEDFVSRVGQSEGYQAATHQRSEGQQDGDNLGDAHEAGKDGAAEDGCQLAESVQHAKRRGPVRHRHGS